MGSVFSQVRELESRESGGRGKSPLMSQPETKILEEIHPVLSLVTCECCDDESDSDVICIKPRRQAQVCSPSCQCGGDDDCGPVPELVFSSDEEDIQSPKKPTN